MAYEVRRALMEDLPRIEEIYAYARQFMAEHGNPNQWGKVHPPVDQLKQDIDLGDLYVVTEAGEIHGVFYFFIGPDPTYGYVEGGVWREDTPYGTIHRIAGDGSGGILRAAVSFCRSKIAHVRIDTHEDNHVMQNAVARQGFQRVGIIYLENGDPRIAYDLVKEKEYE